MIACVSAQFAIALTPLPETRNYFALGRNLVAYAGVAACVGLGVVAAERWTGLPSITVILAAAAATIMLVVFGIRRPNLDPSGPSMWKLCYSLSSRESIVPLGLAGGLLGAGLVEAPAFASVLLERYPILWLIMTFAVLAYGMERAGVFRYLAVWTLVWCRGSVPKLTIGFFALSSALTYLASNDIVVLVMTPLVVELSRQSGIRDVRLILLVGCFIAANTLSMGMVFGSPSNIIVALATDMGFVEYLRLMMLPTLITAGASLLTVSFVYAFAVVFAGGLPAYSPAGIRPVRFSRAMGWQCVLFAVALVGYSVSLGGLYPFWMVSLPMTVMGLISARWLRMPHSDEEPAGALDAVCSLPWGIVGFAFSFFLVAEALVTRFPTGLLSWLADLPPVWQLLASLGGTAVLVNTINDLPASALIGDMVATLEVTGWRRSMILQAILVGLNAGCYLSPVGALAGLMWFHMLKRDGARYGLVVPRPVDLLWFGGLHFLVAAVMLCALLPGAHVLWSLMTTGVPPPDLTIAGVFVSGLVAGVAAVTGLIALIVCLWIMFRKKSSVAVE